VKEDQQFYIGQKAFIERNGKILVLNDPILGNDLPGGKIQEGEFDFTEALKREVKEETDLDIEVLSPFAVWYFKVPDDSGHHNAGKMIFTVGYKCKYVSGKLKLSHEHNNYTWIDKHNYQQFKGSWSAYPAIEKYFNKS
jgi:8-oxo-dGTP diphosphatase